VGERGEEVLALAREANFASLTTLTASGAPVASLMWVDAEDDHLVINTERHRLKYRNVSRDPRAHVLIVDREDPGHYAAVQGVVTEIVLGPAAREHIDRLSRKYQGSDFDPRRIVSERVLLRISPVKQRVRHSEVLAE
jgi:PPOX class probable F420-dependent enzyme